MGKTITPIYRIVAPYICFVSRSRKVFSASWDTRRDGQPTPVNIKRWIDAMNASVNHGSNKHLAGTQSDYSQAKVIRQSTNIVVAEYSYPSFTLV